MQNIKLNAYISDDAWWHYRHIEEVLKYGHRLNPDIYEFTTLNRPMTYPPLFHYLVAYSYRLFSRWFSLVRFTHYFNIFEAVLYLLFIYLFSYKFTKDRLFSLIGTLSASVSYGMIIRARAGELMPFVPGDLFALGGILILLYQLEYMVNRAQPAPQHDNKGGHSELQDEKSFLLTLSAGILLGLSLLSWSGGVLIYLPLIPAVFFSLGIARPKLIRKSIGLFVFCLVSILLISFPWYFPLISKYGLNPHSQEMHWFMKDFTVLHQIKPLGLYIMTSGSAIFFLPLVFLNTIYRSLKKEPLDIFLTFWIILGVVATYSGWRGYVAVVPIIAAITMSVGASRTARFLFKERKTNITWVFIFLFLLVGGIGYYISESNISPLDQERLGELRSNIESIRMLQYLRENYPAAITIDHITWVSEDEAVGGLRMVAGQYLEYLPQGASEVFKDVSRFYLSGEEAAYKICKKYNVRLAIFRKHFLQLPQLSILFSPPEIKSDEYIKISRLRPNSLDMRLDFTAKGRETMLFKMINRMQMKNFELIYSSQGKEDPLPQLAVYKVNEPARQ